MIREQDIKLHDCPSTSDLILGLLTMVPWVHTTTVHAEWLTFLLANSCYFMIIVQGFLILKWFLRNYVYHSLRISVRIQQVSDLGNESDKAPLWTVQKPRFNCWGTFLACSMIGAVILPWGRAHSRFWKAQWTTSHVRLRNTMCAIFHKYRILFV